jgi:hypothetical protein
VEKKELAASAVLWLAGDCGSYEMFVKIGHAMVTKIYYRDFLRATKDTHFQFLALTPIPRN